jgi:F-type H+-transporting ATPase subunit c
MIRKILMSAVLGFVALSSVAFAEEGVAAATSNGGGYGALAAAIAIGLAVFGGASAQGKAASAALEGIARNPAAGDKLFTPMIISLALIESLVLLAFVIAFLKITNT